MNSLVTDSTVPICANASLYPDQGASTPTRGCPTRSSKRNTKTDCRTSNENTISLKVEGEGCLYSHDLREASPRISQPCNTVFVETVV